MLDKLKEILPHLDAAVIGDKINKVITEIPVLNLVPMFGKMASEVPARWDAVPEDKKQALFNSLIAAGTRAAADYATKGAAKP